MIKNEILSEIYVLASNILLGKATEEEIERVTSLAKNNNMLGNLKEELELVGRTLNE